MGSEMCIRDRTSGGLVFGVGPEEAEITLNKLIEAEHDAAVIGKMNPGSGLIRLSSKHK